MKTKTIVLGLAFIAIPLLMKAQNCDAYFPYKKGMVLEQQTFNAKNKLTGSVKQVVTDITNGAMGKKVDLKSEYFDDKGKSAGTANFSVTCKNGVIQIDMRNYMDAKSRESFSGANVTVEGTPLDLPTVLSPGQKLADGTMTIKMSMENSPIAMNMEMRIYDRKVEGMESVTTPAGTFECYKISYMVDMKMMFNITAKGVEYYSKEYGLIKSESYDKKGKLTSYTILSKVE